MINRVRFIYSVSLAATLFLGSLANVPAQTGNRKINPQTLPAAANSKKEPYKSGETLVYEAEYSRLLLRGIDAADLTLSVTGDDQAKDNKFQFTAEAASKGILLRLISYSFRQKFDCTVQADNFRILQTMRYDEQDKQIRNSQTNFDYGAKKLTYREFDSQKSGMPQRVITSSLEDPAQDIISSIYFLRRLPLGVGKSFVVRLSDSGVVYEVPFKVAGREQMKTVLGKVWTLRVEPEIFGDKKPFAGEGKMTIWITDDARRVPVRSEIQAKVGKIAIKLRRAVNLQAL